jgi:transcription antitermination factor NusG
MQPGDRVRILRGPFENAMGLYTGMAQPELAES